MFKVITLSDSNYFAAGKLFLETRSRVNADFVLYGPDLTDTQISVLKKHDIEYIQMDEEKYKTQMQFLKFGLMLEQLALDTDKTYKGFSLVDFDTFFINDWKHIFDYEFDYGITIRNDMVCRKLLRAYTNGGVTFAKHSAVELLNFAEQVVLKGNHTNLPEYDKIWRTLEIGRPEHKTHYRTTLRWWVDQVFLSAVALRYFENYGYANIGLKPPIFNFDGTNVGLFGCNYYNVLESKPNTAVKKNIYIRHLKTTGRNSLGVNTTKEKL